jgi:UDP-glucose 4,6-dehydratase
MILQVLEPTNPYAATKAGAEFLAKSYHRSFGMPIIITRGNNVYGPHQYPEKMIPKFINQLMRGRKVTLHGDGLNTRNFLFVEDVARAFEVILFKGEVGKIYNIGGTNEKTNIEVASQLIKISGHEGPVEERMVFVEDRVFNDLRYYISCDKLHALGKRKRR